jgi:hypothetical protein
MGLDLTKLIEDSNFALLDNNLCSSHSSHRSHNWFFAFDKADFINVGNKFYNLALNEINKMIAYYKLDSSFTVENVINEWEYVYDTLGNNYDKRLENHDKLSSQIGDRLRYQKKKFKLKKRSFYSESKKKKMKFDSVVFELEELIGLMNKKKYGSDKTLFKAISEIRNYLPHEIISDGLLSDVYHADEELISVCIKRAMNGQKTNLFTCDLKLKKQLKYTLFIIDNYFKDLLNFPPLKELYGFITIYSVNHFISEEVINQSTLRKFYHHNLVSDPIFQKTY